MMALDVVHELKSSLQFVDKADAGRLPQMSCRDRSAKVHDP